MLQQRPGRVFAAVPRQTSRPLVQPPNRVPSREASPQPSPLHSSLLGRTTPSRPAMTPEPGSGAMTPETPVHLQMPSVLPSSGSRVSSRGTTRLVAPVRNSCELASASSSNSRSSPTPRVWETLTRTRTPPLKPADSRSMSAVASQQNMKPGHLPSRPGRQEIRKPVLRQGSLHERMKSQVATSSSPRAPMNVADEHLAFANACSVPSCGGASRLLQKRKTHPGQRSLKGASTRTPPRFLKTPDTNQFQQLERYRLLFVGT
jgi:hypothetical protein